MTADAAPAEHAALAKPPGGVHTMIECLHIERAALLCTSPR